MEIMYQSWKGTQQVEATYIHSGSVKPNWFYIKIKHEIYVKAL